MTGSDAAELAALCRDASKSVDWVQAAGGNASIKDEAGGWLRVKASGLRLGEVTENTGWVQVSLAGVRACLEDASLEALPHGAQQDAAGERLMKALAPGSPAGRASLEAEFHALGSRVCLHVHLVEASAFVCLEKGRELLAEALRPLGQAWAWADYRPPGHSLAVQVAQGLQNEPAAKVAFLSRHGLIVWAETSAEALNLVAMVQSRLLQALPKAPAPNLPVGDLEPCLKALAKAFPGLAIRRPVSEAWAASLAQGGDWSWQPICPDDVIYAGEIVPCLEPPQAGDSGELLRLFGPQPKQVAMAVKGRGVCVAASDERRAAFLEEMLYANARARALGRGLGKVWPLTRDQGREIIGMKSEQYRADK